MLNHVHIFIRIRHGEYKIYMKGSPNTCVDSLYTVDGEIFVLSLYKIFVHDRNSTNVHVVFAATISSDT